MRIKRALLKFARGLIGRGFAAWIEAMDEAVFERILLQRTIASILHVKLRAAYNGWLEASSVMKRQRVIMNRIIRRIAGRCLVTAWDTWTASVTELSRQRRIVRRVLRKCLHRTLARAFDAWADWLAHISGNQRKVWRTGLAFYLSSWFRCVITYTPAVPFLFPPGSNGSGSDAEQDIVIVLVHLDGELCQVKARPECGQARVVVHEERIPYGVVAGMAGVGR
jgi:hypothetical protein